MVKNKMVNRLVSLLCALFLLVSSVLVPYQTAYASVSITEAGSYFLRMLCSAAGIYFEHSEVGLVVDVLSQVAAQSDTINSKEFKERMDYVLSLSPADRIEETFSNAFLADLINGFRESTVNEDGHGGGGISFPLLPDILVVSSDCTLTFNNQSHTVRSVTAPIVLYCYVNGNEIGICYVSTSSFYTNGNSPDFHVRDIYWIAYEHKYYGTIEDLTSMGLIYLDNVKSYDDLKQYLASASYVFPDLTSTNLSAERVWVDAFDDAALHVPAITAPITIPADVAAMEENAKAVAAADNADALYKALAAAGIAIGVDVDVPDETDKPTDAEIPDEGTSTIGKSLSDILAAITGMADKIGAIPAQIENFFTIDTDAISDAFMGLKDAFSSRFDAILKVADMFTNLSPKLDSSVPLISIRIPQSLQPIYNAEEVVVFDLRGFEDTCKLVRLFFRALLWFGFGYVVLREFDVKFHVS